MEQDVPWTRNSAYVLVRDDEGRVLLSRISAELPDLQGLWSMPGGGLDWGEHPVDAARRELEEETGITADIGDVIGIFSRVYAWTPERPRPSLHMIGLVFRGTNPRGELRHEATGTSDHAAWFTLEEIRDLPHVELVDFCVALC